MVSIGRRDRIDIIILDGFPGTGNPYNNKIHRFLVNQFFLLIIHFRQGIIGDIDTTKILVDR